MMKLNPNLQARMNTFRSMYPTEQEAVSRITKPSMPFYGTDILEKAVTALLEGENLLLCGDKATGKMYWLRIWHGFLEDPFIIFLSMSTQTAATSLAQIPLRIMKSNSAKDLFISVPSMAVSVFWMKLIWQKMMQFLYSTPPWITDASWMFQVMTGFSFTLPPALLQP